MSNDITRKIQREIRKIAQDVEKKLTEEMKKSNARAVTIHLPDGETTTWYTKDSYRPWGLNPTESGCSTTPATTSSDAEDAEVRRRFTEWLKANDAK